MGSKSKYANQIVPILQKAIDDNYLSKFKEDTNHQFDTINKAIGPYIQQGIASNSNPPIMNLNNNNNPSNLPETVYIEFYSILVSIHHCHSL